MYNVSVPEYTRVVEVTVSDQMYYLKFNLDQVETQDVHENIQRNVLAPHDDHPGRCYGRQLSRPEILANTKACVSSPTSAFVLALKTLTLEKHPDVPITVLSSGS